MAGSVARSLPPGHSAISPTTVATAQTTTAMRRLRSTVGDAADGWIE
jgi:hypothetical protein